MNYRLDEAMETASDAVDQAAAHSSAMECAAEEPRDEKPLLRAFPFFVAACLAIWICSIIYIDSFKLVKMIELLCLSFTFCFAVLGVPCALHLPKGVFPFRDLSVFALGLTTLLWIFNYATGEYYYADAIYDILSAVGIHLPDLLNATVGFLGTLAVMLFTSIGVTTVISSYLRRYIPEVIDAMNAHAERKVRGKAESFFMVPDIIDVHEVVVDPPASKHLFDLKRTMSISTYLFILGLLVSSYLFVNPYFLEVMSWKTMLAITVMLSMFTPALILPWQIFRSIGAKAKSEAHRDYYLWKGAKNRLFTTFTALGVFMMMFLLSVYLGNDAFSIILNYVLFLVPLLLTSIMYGVLYTNNFEREDRAIICGRCKRKQAERRL